MQKRWVAGIAYSMGFLLCFVFSFVYAGKIMVMYYGLWNAEESSIPPVEPMLFKMILFFAIAIVVFVVNLIDAYSAHRRLAREWSLKNAGRHTGAA